MNHDLASTRESSDAGKVFKIAFVSDLHYSELQEQHGPLLLNESIRIGGELVGALNASPTDLVVWAGDMTHEGTDTVRRGFAGLVNHTQAPSVVLSGNHDVDRVSKREYGNAVLLTRQAWLSTNGWNILMLDTVRELSRDDATGRFANPDLQMLIAACAEEDTPLLVLGHHPLNDKWIDQTPFWDAVQGRRTLSVYVGAHTHQFVFRQQGPWHLFETGSVTVAPSKYCEIHLQSNGMVIRTRTTSTSIDGVYSDAMPVRSIRCGDRVVSMSDEWW